MTRGATVGFLPDDHHQKHPQPVIASLEPRNGFTTPPNASQQTSRQASRRSSVSHRSNGHNASDSDDEDGGLHMQRQSNHTVLSRATSDLNQRARPDDPNLRMRHGWEAQLETSKAALLTQSFFMYFEDKRHETAGNPPGNDDTDKILVSEWRMKDRLKTVSAILAVCLNVGVDPPDAMKPNPCARLECWVDPIPPEPASQSSTTNNNALIGKNLQAQYENLSLRTRYKVILDPTIEELKKYTVQLRRQAHAERVLFHYNGHGVPKPTHTGEVWCFNRSYTQYIPVSMYDLQDCIGAPGLYVWDCSAAGGIVSGFLEAAKKHATDKSTTADKDAQAAPINYLDSIHLAACLPHQSLPSNPLLPADLFTSCLTTPIAMAVRFFLLSAPLPSHPPLTPASLAAALAIPGKVSERRTPLGELNWIFTAITDTIAWNCLERGVFKKLFRQDLMVAALFRNFLLAQRVMRRYHCNPVSHPKLPDTHDHPLWASWDLAVEGILAQLPSLFAQQKAQEGVVNLDPLVPVPSQQPSTQPPQQLPPQIELEYTHSTFFADQLSAFEVYLSSTPPSGTSTIIPPHPPQLPIVLQVLLSHVHRLRALILLSKFLDLGPWAVHLALSIGIFPYVLKLLQSQALELKPPMVFIWARILAVDGTCQSDLLKDSGFTYFTSILTATPMTGGATVGASQGNVAEHKAMCAFILAEIMMDFPPAQHAVLETCPEVIDACLGHLADMENPLLRQFSCLCLGALWKGEGGARGKQRGMSGLAHARVRDRSHDPVPEVRASCLWALGCFVGAGGVEMGVTARSRDSKEREVGEEETLASVIVAMGMDGSVMVRKELTVFYSVFVKKYERRVVVAAWEQLLEERAKRGGRSEGDDMLDLDGGVSKKTIYRAMWRQCLSMSADPHPEVSRNASVIVDYIINALLESPLGDYANKLLDEIVLIGAKTSAITTSMELRPSRPQTPPSPTASTASRSGDSYFGLSRTASVAAAMKNMIGIGSWNSRSDGPPSPTTSTRSTHPYRSRPLSAHDATIVQPPDALDTIPGPPHQPPAKIPPSPFFQARDLTKIPELPLKSRFFAWSASYFREPQMRPSEADEPGSLDYNERLWRRNRNDKIIASTQPLKNAAGSQRWDVPCGYFGIGAAPVKMVFHQFENHLVTSDDRDSIAVWDWKQATQLARFSNGNPGRSRVTELRFINEDDQAMLMTGSSDGVIRIYRDYDKPKRVTLASSFRALSDLVVSDQQNAGLVFDWQQGQGKVLVAGDDRVIRVWHAGHELCIADIPARSGSCITSLTSDQVEGNIFVAGFGNGAVRAYDQRIRGFEAMVMAWDDKVTDHKSWIVGVHLQRGGLRELISAESNGGVRLWDIRNRGHVSGLEGNVSRGPRQLRTLSVHEHAPVFATGGADHTIRVYSSAKGLKSLSSAEPYMSFLRGLGAGGGARLQAPITAMALHPHRLMLACGAVNDGHVNLFKCEVGSEEKRESIVEEWRA